MNLKYFDHYQINKEVTEQSELSIENNKIKSFTSGTEELCKIRVWKNNKQASVTCNKMDEKVIENLKRILRSNDKLEYFHGLPKKARYEEVKIYDENISLGPEKLIEYGKECIKEMGKIRLNSAVVSSARGTRTVKNSEGVYASEQRTNFFVTLSGILGSSTSSEFRAETFHFDNKELCSELKTKIKDFSHPKKLDIKLPTVIFRPSSFSSLMKYAFLENFNGKNYEKGRSIFTGKIGKKLLGNINIYDDPTYEFGISSSTFDYEGTPTKTNLLVEDGVVLNLIYDYNTSKHNKKINTANASLNGIDFSNIMVKGPYEEIDDAIIVDSIIGAHTANPLTTDFSVKVHEGYLKRKNKLTPIRGFMVSGKMIDLLKNTISVGRNVEQRGGIYSGDIGCRGISIIL